MTIITGSERSIVYGFSLRRQNDDKVQIEEQMKKIPPQVTNKENSPYQIERAR